MVAFSKILILATSIYASTSSAAAAVNSKRGIVYMPHDDYTNDYQHWTAPLSWYYNYGSSPASELASTGMTFIPMLWGDKNGMAENFIPNVNKLSGVTHVLAINEPDIDKQYGGTQMSVSDAVTLWKQYVQPLAAKGIKLGAPAVSGSPNGFTWIQNFVSQCSGCTIDFIPLHYYGNFAGLASRLGQFNAAFPNKPLWVTEFADANDQLASTTSNTQQMINYMDKLSYVERYSYFGAVRSNVCNVGANAALMDANGNMNSLGQMYISSGAVSAPSLYASSSAVVAPTPIKTASPTYASPQQTTLATSIKPKSTIYQTHSVINTVSVKAPAPKSSSSSSSSTKRHHHSRHYSSRYASQATAAAAKHYAVVTATATQVAYATQWV